MEQNNRFLLVLVGILLCGIAFVSHQAGAIASPITGYEVLSDSTVSDGEDFKELGVPCPEGKVAIGGGAGIYYDSVEGHQLLPYLVSSFMYPDNTTWFAEAIQPEVATTDWRLEVQVICVDSKE